LSVPLHYNVHCAPLLKKHCSKISFLIYTEERTHDYSFLKYTKCLHKERREKSWKEWDDVMQTIQKCSRWLLENLLRDEARGGVRFKSENSLDVKSY
jgi:hypothetical protein